jgi:glycosyltransferase involved in cell wall biosynthesis
MHVTVCVPTRDRKASLVRTLRALARLDYPDFDVIVVDQTAAIADDPADASETILADLLACDARFTYIRSRTTGTSAARNLAIARARGQIVAFTDDDCEPASDWLRQIVAHFHTHPDVGLICGDVRPAPHDRTTSYVLTASVGRPRRIASPWLKWRDVGIGANMAFRREVLRVVGPYDELLCPGSALHSGQDRDITYRVLRAGYVVLDTPAVWVLHHGIRSLALSRARMHRTALGLGAAWMKYLRIGDVAVLPTLLHDWVGWINWGRLVRLRRGCGVSNCVWFAWGLLASFRHEIDPRRRVYTTSVGSGMTGTRAAESGQMRVATLSSGSAIPIPPTQGAPPTTRPDEVAWLPASHARLHRRARRGITRLIRITHAR